MSEAAERHTHQEPAHPVRSLLGRAYAALLLCLAASPHALMMLVKNEPALLPMFPLIPAGLILASMLCMALPGRLRIPAAALACIASAAGCLTAGYCPARSPRLILLLGACALLLVSLPLAGQRRRAGVSAAAYCIGLAVQVLAHLTVWAARRMKNPVYEPVVPAMTAVFAVYILLSLLEMNRVGLSRATLGRQSLPKAIRRFNTALTCAMFVLGMLIASMPAFARLMRAVWNALAAAIMQFLRLLASLMPEGAVGTGGMGGAQEPMMLGGEAAEPSLLAVILEKIAIIAVCLLLIALVIPLLRRILRLLQQAVNRLQELMKAYIASVAEDGDEITDTRSDKPGCEQRDRLGPLSSLLRRAGPQDRTPSGRIRAGYARLLRRRPQWAPSSTARENLPPEAASLYEQARYSEHPVTPQDAERFAERTRRL